MIYLSAEIISGLGEDTFWTWFKREFPNSSFDLPLSLNNDDILLRYSTLGFYPIIGKQLSLCWELYPEMKKVYDSSTWDNIIEKVNETARYSTYRTVPTEFTVKYYQNYGSVDVIPIGVDADLFKPLNNKSNLREKYNLPKNKKIGIWVGTSHPMKGMTKLLEYHSSHPEVEIIAVWKSQYESWNIPNVHNFIKIEQKTLNELFNTADFFISTNMLSAYYMAEWEAMASNLPFISLGATKEFRTSLNPRNDFIKLGWSRTQVKKLWEKYLTKRGIVW